MLTGKGFTQVFNVKGGIKAWEGVKAWGPVELNMDLVTGEESPGEVVVIAYGMEEGLWRLYGTAAERTSQSEVLSLLERLGSIEERHKQDLVRLYADLGAGSESDLRSQAVYERFEGGGRADVFLKENDQAFESAEGCLQLAMMLEAQALDLYSRFAERMSGMSAREVLYKLAEEEKTHLGLLGGLLERVLGRGKG